VKLGANGIEQLLEIQLNKEEQELMDTSSMHVKAVMDVYDGMM
jgi:malate/lactate dehydrogenase